MSGAVKTILPIAGAAAGFFMGGGPAGAAAGYQLGSMAGGAIGGGDEQQPMQPGVTPQQGPMMPGQTRNPATGAIEGQPRMALPSAPGGDAAKAQRLIMALGPMLAQSEGLKSGETSRRLDEAQIQRLLNPPPIMPSGVSAGGIGMGPNAGFSYLGGR
jgi:hypothetical protein